MRLRIRWWEVIAAVLLVLIAAALLLPALARAREGARRSSCQNNLKEFGLVLKMYCGEDPGEMFPPVSRRPNTWMMDIQSVYPEYLSDPNILVCPSSPLHWPEFHELRRTTEHPGARVGEVHPDCIGSLFYTYTGYVLLNEEEAVALYDAYHTVPGGLFLARDLELNVPVWADSAGSALGAFAMIEDERAGSASAQSAIPVMWDRLPLFENEFAHVPRGANVLYLDGHVDFIRYGYYNAWEQFPVTPIIAETFGNDAPQLSTDCY